MNTSTRMAVVLGICALLSFAAGVLRANLGASAAQPAGTRELEQPVEQVQRPVAASLATLGTYNHWGEYQAPQTSEVAPASAAERAPSVDTGTLAGRFRLVGIETDQRGRSALLQALGATMSGPGADTSLLRLRLGEVLVEGITVESLGEQSVSLRGDTGTTTLYLYGDSQ